MRNPALAGTGLVALCWLTALGAAGPRSVNDGVYTADQAARGARVFRDRCASCHTTEPFTGPAFYTTWPGPLDGLFELMRATVPDDNPGTMAPAAYADVIAYFLSLNGYPAGAEPLGHTAESLAGIVLEPPGLVYSPQSHVQP